MGDGKKICIHGHFYQPPREDPWMDTIFPEGSAAPAKHWNERICSESYSPLAWARRLDGEGRITELMNCYEWMSFNFGPTLLTWMERQAPDTYARMLEGDAKSLARLGHGNAIAQIYHHIIMPLATHTERRAEIAWALADFEARFKRPAEGMWLSEAAVDTETLDLLAQAGVAFTILAPRQAREVADLNQDNWTAAHEGNLDIRQPYRVELPQGRSIAVYFYNGPLSQAVAFEGVLGHGDRFWSWLSSLSGQGLLALATDGETYGHHFKFGEMALAHALSQARAGVDGVEICNYGAYLAANPPSRRVRIHENSSWSCVHGVERWRSDCGCCAEHKPGWNQRWRGPLRDGLRDLKTHLDTHFVKRGAEVFRDAEDALVHYGRVLCGQDDDAAFERAYFKKGLNPAQRDVAWKLLTMQKWALSSFASCAWFFDDLGRIEPLNALTYALRALGLAQRTGAGDLESVLLAHIGQASSNEPALGSGLDLWNREIRPRRESTESLVAQALLTLWAESGIPEPEGAASISWPGLTVEIRVAQHGEDVPAAQKNTAQSATTQDGPAIELSGTANITWAKESGSDACTWHWERPHCGGPLTGCVQIGAEATGFSGAKCVPASYISWGKRQAIALAWVRRAEEENWDEQCHEASQGAHLFQSYREAQTTQTAAPRWGRLWSALCWQWLLGEVEPAGDFLHFLMETGRNHPERCLLAERAGVHVLALLSTEPEPDFAGVCGIIERAALAELPLDLRPAQNLFWAKYLDLPKAAPARQALGFAPR